MMVTIGGRGTGAPSSSGRSNRPSSTSDSATRLTEWPISSAMSCALSASSTSVSVTMRPWRIKSLITSTARSDMRLASSWMVIASGRTISRAIFSFWSCAPWPFSRCVRRRNEATERVRSSSPEVALVTVSRPRLRCSPPRAGRGVGTRTFCPGRLSAGRLTTRRASSSSPPAARASAPGRALARGLGRGAGPTGMAPVRRRRRRRRASSSDCRLKLASCARRSSSSRLRASAASRSRRSRASRSRRASASAPWRRRSSSSCARASLNARARASRCSAVKVGRTTPVLGGGGAVGFAGATGAGRAAPASGGFVGLGATGDGASGEAVAGRAPAGVSPGPECAASPSRRRPPCCARARSSVSPCPAQQGASGAKSPSAARPSQSCRYYPFHSCHFLTAWLFSQFDGATKRSGLVGVFAAALCSGRRVRFAVAITAQTIRPCEKGRTRRPMFEGSMYHICPPQRQIQLARRKEIDAQDSFRLRAEVSRATLGPAWPLRRPPRRSPESAPRRRQPRSPSRL